MENKDQEIPDLNYTEDKINFLLENAEKLPQFLSKDEIEKLVNVLKDDLVKIEETIEKLKELDEN